MDKKPVGTQYIICECGDNFPNQRLLDFHLENDHGDVDNFLCEYCPEIFPSAQLYKHHIRQHNVRKPENKPSENPKPHSKTDKTPDNVIKKGPKSLPVIKLKNLKKIDYVSLIQRPGLALLEVAAEEVAETNTISSEEYEVRYYKCNVCHKIFASEEFYLRHYNKVHANMLTVEIGTENNQEAPPEDIKEEPLVSTESQDYCIEEYQRTEPKHEVKMQSIKLEEPTVSPEAPEEDQEQVVFFKCDLCKVLYPSEEAYISHYNKKHTGAQMGLPVFQVIEQDLEGPYLPPPKPKQDEVYCQLCQRTFADKRSFAIHYRLKHCPDRVKSGGGVASKVYECEICGKKCNSNFNLVYHQRTHTGEKPFECSECQKRFSGPQLLQIHFRTHTGERPYKCVQCPKAFVNRAALARHERVHTGAKPYSCQHCGKSFSQSNSMKLHVRTVHLKLPAPYRNPRNKKQ